MCWPRISRVSPAAAMNGPRLHQRQPSCLIAFPTNPSPSPLSHPLARAPDRPPKSKPASTLCNVEPLASSKIAKARYTARAQLQSGTLSRRLAYSQVTLIFSALPLRMSSDARQSTTRLLPCACAITIESESPLCQCGNRRHP